LKEYNYEDFIDEIKHWFLYSSYAYIDYEALPKCEKMEVIETIDEGLDFYDMECWFNSEEEFNEAIDQFWEEYEEKIESLRKQQSEKEGFISVVWDTPDFVAYAIAVVECVED